MVSHINCTARVFYNVLLHRDVPNSSDGCTAIICKTLFSLYCTCAERVLMACEQGCICASPVTHCGSQAAAGERSERASSKGSQGGGAGPLHCASPVKPCCSVRYCASFTGLEGLLTADLLADLNWPPCVLGLRSLITAIATASRAAICSLFKALLLRAV